MENRDRQRYARHLLMPEIGLSGQETFLKSRFVLAGEGAAMHACAEALTRSGAGVDYWNEATGEPAGLLETALCIVLARDTEKRRLFSRRLRRLKFPALFGWEFPGGCALARLTHVLNCPCLECVESSNLKMFRPAPESFAQTLGAQAASEALLGVLSKSPLRDAVWVTLDSGVSIREEAPTAASCAASKGGPDA